MAETDKDDLVTIIDEEDHQDIVPDILPLMPVRDVVIFTDMLLPLFVGRKKSIRAVEEALTKDGYLLLATQKDPNVEDPGADDIYTVGTVGRILRMLKLPDGRAKTLVQGVSKVKIKRYVRKRGFYRVKIEALEEVPLEELNIEVEALMRNVREFSEKILALRGELTSDVSAILESIENPGKLADLVASNLKLKIDEAQDILETIDPVQRLEKVNTLLSREMNLSAIQAKIQSEVKDEISKNQRDYFLREQMRAINRELGEGDDRAQEIEDYQKKIRKSGMPKEARDEAGKQLRRLEQMHSDSAEAAIIRTYLDWMVEVPWQKSTKDMLDIAYARKVLDREHYGLSKIKDRILEYLSVRKLNPKMKGPILCLVGPPGVGKTSLGQAIAKAMKRKFVRLSLGGIHDEAEIRGHRRTYIGALPGRIIQGLKQCKVNNPIFMMDEIDKLGSDFRGDPSSALLEALDPEQNSAFSDHYLNLPFDLSNVMFILTANLTDTIPSPLLDRMEVINLSGYTEEEKHKIATDYLLPRQIKNNGLTARNIRFSDGAIQQMITEYTLEAGLRNLEREFGTICRKVARKIAEGRKGPYNITQKNLSRYLGPPSFQAELDKDESQVGLVTGLAWTQTGGEVLYVETSMLPGKGELIMTGQLGDVMQESGRAVNKDVAMTGEISLRGRVLPIGGLKEKAMGALRGKVFTVIIPEKNRKDLIDIPANVKRKLKFVIVRHMDEVLKIALEPAPVNKTKQAPARKKPAKKRTAAAKRK